MKIAEYISRPSVPALDLGILNSSANILESSHKEAVQATSALKQAIAQADLNEDEREWRQGKVNEVQSILNNNTLYGNSAAAVDDLIAASGDILFGADMQGRLKRQQAWKANNDKIDKMNITEDYKRIFKELNPYGKYEDKYNKDGQVIEGEAWKPTVNPVNTVPLNDILNNALKWAAKEAGGGTVTRWLDANGNVTDDPSKSVTGEYYSATTGSWQRLTKEKLAAAVEASIDTIPGARESLKQDYDIAKWKYDNNEESDILDKTGVIMTPTEYLTKRIDPFYKAATYYNQTSETKYGDAVKAQLAYRATQAATDSNGNTGIDPLQVKSNPITIKNTQPIKAQESINISKQRIANVLSKIGVNGDVSKMTYDEIEAYAANVKDANDRYDIYKALSDWQTNQTYMDSIRETLDPEAKAMYDEYIAITSMSDTNAGSEYNYYVNKFFNGGNAIRQYFSDANSIEAFKLNIGGERKAADLGIKFGSKNGKAYAELPVQFNKALHLFGNAATNTFNETHNFFGTGWQRTKNSIYSGWGDNLMRVNEDGSESPILDDTLASPMFKRNLAETAFRKLNSYMKKLEDNYNTSIGQAGNLTLSNDVITQATPALAEISFMMKNNPTEASKLTNVYKLNEDEVLSAAQSLDFVQHGGYLVTDKNTFEQIPSKDRVEITNRLRNSKPNDLIINGAQDPNTGNWGIQVTIKGYNKEGEVKTDPVTIFVPDIDSKTYEKWNINTSFIAKNKVNVYHAAKRPILIAESNIYGLPNNISLVPNGSGFDVIDGKNVVNHISMAQAVDVTDTYEIFNQTLNAIKAGNVYTVESVNSLAKKVANQLAITLGYGQEYATAIYNNISYSQQ